MNANATTWPVIWILMGPSGSGKSTVGRLLAGGFECDFIEGDRRHPPANVAKMARGEPLDAADRRIWLYDLTAELGRRGALTQETVVTCSALGRATRDTLSACGRVCFLYPKVAEDELRQRLDGRDHFFDSALLASQLAALDDIAAEEPVIVLDGEQPPEAITAEAEERIAERWPERPKRWWELGISGV